MDSLEKKGYITLTAKRKDFGITKSVDFSFTGIERIEEIIDLLKRELGLLVEPSKEKGK